MDLEIWMAYIGTLLVLMITPGPSQLLIGAALLLGLKDIEQN